MKEENHSQNVSVLSNWLDQKEPMMELIEEYYPEGLPDELLSYVQNEILETYNQYPKYRSREINHIQQYLKKFSSDFLRSLHESEWSGIEEVLFDSEYILNPRARNGIKLLYQNYQSLYFQFVNKYLHPLSLFPLFNSKEPKDRMLVQHLVPALQALYCKMHWERLITDIKTDAAQHLEHLHLKLPKENQLMLSGCILEQLLRNKKNAAKEYWKEACLAWITSTWEQEIITKENIDVFLNALTGRANRESWLGALIIANRLSSKVNKISQHNADLLRRRVIDEYPNLWNSKNINHEYVLISGNDSVDLARELANVFFSNNMKLSDLLSQRGISDTIELWNLQNRRDYSNYFNKRKLCFIHFLVVAFFTEKYFKQNGKLPEHWDMFVNRFLDCCKQRIDDHVSGVETIMKELLSKIGWLLQRSNQLLKLAPVILAYLPLPEYNVYLMKTINRDSEEYEKLEEMMEGYLLGILPSLRYSKLLDLIYNTYQVEAFKLCVRLFTNAPLDVWLADQNNAIFVGRIYSSAVLNTLQSKDTTQIDLESLPKASAFMNRIRRKYISFKNTHFDLLQGYLLGWLFEFDLYVSPNEILTYLNHSGNLDNLDEIKDDLNPFLAFAKARLAVYIIAKREGFDKSEMIEVLENALSYAKSAGGIEGLTWLMDAWFAEQLKDTTRKITSLEKAQTYVEQIQERQLLLPKVLDSTVEEVSGIT